MTNGLSETRVITECDFETRSRFTVSNPGEWAEKLVSPFYFPQFDFPGLNHARDCAHGNVRAAPLYLVAVLGRLRLSRVTVRNFSN